jgi:hypothetical protein
MCHRRLSRLKKRIRRRAGHEEDFTTVLLHLSPPRLPFRLNHSISHLIGVGKRRRRKENKQEKEKEKADK